MNNRMLVTTALAAIMGLTALAPGAYAQSAPAAPDAPAVTQPDAKGPGPQGEHRGERGQRGGIAGLICSTDGATQLETRLADIATKLALTAEQQPLFEAYRTATLTAQTSFAESCATLQPATAPTTPPDALTVLKDRQARQTAELDALNAVLPSFEALYNSLTDAQKAALMPLVGPHHGGEHGPRGDRAGRGDDHRGGEHDGGRGRDGRAG
ncbi:Spy/CpxP family protein refolding chaperone [Devosia sp. LjRoot16]|uniref:Spy/CpxP family protein refolding chaperone n=1 Tax=Devosia sp. LjRoot16 TaxID=3342271 RepID=UPI003ECD2763